MKKVIWFVIVFFLLSSLVFTKAYFMGKKEMLKKTEAIVIVKIKSIEKVKQRGRVWTYRQKAIGSIEKNLKGNIGSVVSSPKCNSDFFHWQPPVI